MKDLFTVVLRQSLKDMRVAHPGYFKKISFTDRLLEWTILRIIPDWMTPNHFTIARFLSIPLIIAVLLSGYMVVGTILFVLSAFSDAVDGALARTRNKVTNWGIINDPLADKLLIGTVVAIMVSRYIHPFVAFAIIGLEMFIFGSALYRTRYGGKIVPAKPIGKLKMICESVGLGFVFLFALTGSSIALYAGWSLLYLGIFFALMSIFVYKSI